MDDKPADKAEPLSQAKLTSTRGAKPKIRMKKVLEAMRELARRKKGLH